MENNASDEMKLAKLAAQTGVSRRTIRYYISRGLMEGPLRRGRNAVYGRQHLDRLAKIQELQRSGLTLKEVANVLAGKGPRKVAPRPSSWWRYPVTHDVEVLVSATVSPWRNRQVRRALARLAAELTAREKEREDDDSDD